MLTATAIGSRKITGHKTRSVIERYHIVRDCDLRDAARRLDGDRHQSGFLDNAREVTTRPDPKRRRLATAAAPTSNSRPVAGSGMAVRRMSEN